MWQPWQVSARRPAGATSSWKAELRHSRYVACSAISSPVGAPRSSSRRTSTVWQLAQSRLCETCAPRSGRVRDITSIASESGSASTPNATRSPRSAGRLSVRSSPRPAGSSAWHPAQPAPSRASTAASPVPAVSAASVSAGPPAAAAAATPTGAWQRRHVSSIAARAPGFAAISRASAAR